MPKCYLHRAQSCREVKAVVLDQQRRSCARARGVAEVRRCHDCDGGIDAARGWNFHGASTVIDARASRLRFPRWASALPPWARTGCTPSETSTSSQSRIDLGTFCR